MAKLEYVIEGFGIRGFFVTKHKWEVRKNVFLTVKTEKNGCVSVFDGGVRAGSMPSELQTGLREFLKTPTSEVLSRTKSVQSVNKGKGPEIPCDIILTGKKNVTVFRNNFKALQETVKSIRKERKDTKIQMIKRKNKDSIEGERKGNKTTDESNLNKRKLESSNKNQNHSKRKREEHLVVDGFYRKIKKPRASTSTVSLDQRKLSEDDCYQLSAFIGKNWQLLGNELGLASVQTDHIEERYRDPMIRIQRMLCLWVESSKDARICDFLGALKTCTSVNYDGVAINCYFEKHHEC